MAKNLFGNLGDITALPPLPPAKSRRFDHRQPGQRVDNRCGLTAGVSCLCGGLCTAVSGVQGRYPCATCLRKITGRVLVFLWQQLDESERLSKMRDLYKEAAIVMQHVLNKQKSIRTAVYASNFKNKKQLLRLCCETLRCRRQLDMVLEINELQDLLHKPIFDHYLLYVLLYEYIFGHGLRKAKKIYADSILQCSAYIDQRLEAIKDVINEAKKEMEQTAGTSSNPRYARINTLKWTVEEALRALQDEGWNILEMEQREDEEGWYKNAVSSMAEDQIYTDCHVKGLLLFPPNTDLHQHWMITNGYLLLQDKASCVASQILKPKEDSHIFDICAAPGMKTTHLAAIVKNKGKIWAIDKAGDRVETMRAVVEKAGATNISIYFGDFLRTDVTDKKFSKVQYALVDPPCSGSGIVKRMDGYIDDAGGKNIQRLRSLSNLQAMLLKHAMKLPNLKKIVYSTCSLHEEENEQVIEEVLNDDCLKERFRLVHAMPKWPHRGMANYSFGDKCLRAIPQIDLTNGFFVAVFKRRKL